LQLMFNELAGSSLNQHLRFLEATDDFHEELRLFFYPIIFDNDYKSEQKAWGLIFPLVVVLFLMVLFCIVSVKYFLKNRA